MVMFIIIQKILGSSRHYHPKQLGSSRHYHPRIFLSIQNFKNVENEQDFEFLAGMLLLRRVVFTKVHGPFGSLDFQTLLVLGPLQKLLLPLTFRSNVPLRQFYYREKEGAFYNWHKPGTSLLYVKIAFYMRPFKCFHMLAIISYILKKSHALQKIGMSDKFCLIIKI